MMNGATSGEGQYVANIIRYMKSILPECTDGYNRIDTDLLMEETRKELVLNDGDTLDAEIALRDVVRWHTSQG